MADFRITFDVAVRCRVVVSAPTEALARKKVRDDTLPDQMPDGENPQPNIRREITHVDTRRRIINVVPL